MNCQARGHLGMLRIYNKRERQARQLRFAAARIPPGAIAEICRLVNIDGMLYNDTLLIPVRNFVPDSVPNLVPLHDTNPAV